MLHDHKTVEFRIFRGGSRRKTSITTLNIERADSPVQYCLTLSLMTWMMGTKCTLSLKERQRELGTIQPRSEKAQGNFFNGYRYLIGRSKEDSLKRQVALSEGTRDNGHKLKYRKFYLNTRKIFCTVRLIEYRNRLSRYHVESPSLDTFKT